MFVLGAVLLGVWLGAVGIDAAPRGHGYTGDTPSLVIGVRVLGECLRHGQLRGCEEWAGNGRVAGAYPLLQYVPAAVVTALGASNDEAVNLLARLNFLAFVAALACAIALGRRFGVAVGVAVGLALLCSTFAYQASTSFGEALVAALLLGCVTFAALGWRGAAFAMGVVACFGKETMPPFVIGLVLVGAAVAEPDVRRLVRRWMPVALCAGMLGALVNALFNVWRYDTLTNSEYLVPGLQQYGVGRIAWSAVQLMLSPAAGVLAFWPVASLLIGGCAVAAVHRVRRHEPFLSWAAPGALLVLTLGFLGILAKWYTPFGWIALGPRLAVPILPAASALAAVLCRDTLGRLGAWVAASGWRLGVAAVAVAAVCWGPLGSPWSHRAAIDVLTIPTPGCPNLFGLHPITRKEQYYRCADAVAWRAHPSPVSTGATAGGGKALAARSIGAAGLAVMLLGVLGLGRRFAVSSAPTLTTPRPGGRSDGLLPRDEPAR